MSKRSRGPRSVKKSTTAVESSEDAIGWADARKQLVRAAAAAQAMASLLAKPGGKSAAVRESAHASGLAAIALTSAALEAMRRVALGRKSRQQAEVERALEKIRAHEE